MGAWRHLLAYRAPLPGRGWFDARGHQASIQGGGGGLARVIGVAPLFGLFGEVGSEVGHLSTVIEFDDI